MLLRRQYNGPLHFTPMHSGQTIGLLCTQLFHTQLFHTQLFQRDDATKIEAFGSFGVAGPRQTIGGSSLPGQRQKLDNAVGPQLGQIAGGVTQRAEYGIRVLP